MASKIADALEVSLDYLVGKTSVEIDSRTLNRLQDIQKLNEHDKATVFEMLDAFLRDRKAKKLIPSKSEVRQLPDLINISFNKHYTISFQQITHRLFQIDA